MNLDLLTALHGRLAGAVQGDLILNRGALQNDALSDHWHACLTPGEDALTLAAPVTLSPLDPAGFFTVTGTAGLLACPARPLTLTFFLSIEADDPTLDAIECLIALGALPSGWTANTAYLAMPAYPDHTSGEPALVPSFFAQTPFSSGQAVYCSYDFTAAPDPDEQNGVAPTTLPAAAGDVSAVAAGVNLTGQLGVNTGNVVWTELGQLLTTLPDHFAVSGLVSQLFAANACQIVLTHDFADAGAYPAISMPGFAAVSASIRQLFLRSGLDAASDIGPALGLMLVFTVADVAIDLELELPIGSGQGSLQALLDPPQPITLDWLTAFHLQQLESLINDSLGNLGDLALNSASGVFTVSPPGLQQFSIAVEPEQCWILIPDVVAVGPVFTFGLDLRRADQTADAFVEIFADWYLGGGDGGDADPPSTVLQLYARSDTGDVTVQLPAGQMLDMDGFLQDLLPNASLPDIELIDLDVEGNFRDMVFSLTAETLARGDDGGNWGVDIHGATVWVTDVQIVAHYAPGAGFTGRLNGAISFGGCAVDLSVDIEDALTIDVSLPQLNVGNLLDDVLQAIDLPDELGNFIVDLDFKADLTNKQFVFTGTSSSPVSLIDGFTFTVNSITVTRQATAPTVAASMQLTLSFPSGEVLFNGSYSAGAWGFSAQSSGVSIALGDLLAGIENMVGLDYPLPSGGLAMTDFSGALGMGTDGHFVFSCSLVDGGTSYGQITFLAEKTAAGWDYVVITELAIAIGTGELPVVGADLGQLLALDDVTLLIASRQFSSDELTQLLQLLPPGAAAPQPQALAQGALLTAQLKADGATMPFSLPLGSAATTRSRAVAAAPSMPANDSTKWFDIHRSFGSVSVDRLGFRYAGGVLSLLFDADMALGPMQLVLSGLGIGSPLDHFSLHPNLDGLGVSLQAGPLSLTGGFIRGSGASYAGILRLSLAEFSLALLGRYSDDGFPSFFVFGLLDAPPLGGPPYCFVEGLAIGLGYNNALILPPLDHVQNFSIVQAAFPALNPFGASPDLDAVLAQLQGNGEIADERGEMWLAAGVRFSSFELIDSFALVTAEFGNKLEFSLIGMAQASIPPDDSSAPIAFAQVAIKASCDPDTGVLQVLGQLTGNSYVLSRACQLSGGFAFCTWFKDLATPAGPVSAGDFVYSLGGYHPLYTVPAHYPAVPRLALFWQVDDAMTVQGDAYFALTPHCVMAGYAVSAIWSSGSIRAWYDLAVDFLMFWKPFRYSASLSCSIGVSYRMNLLFVTVTIPVEVDVSLTLAGPDFGGSATIGLRICSITISFGADSSDPPPLLWNDFCIAFLPAPLPSVAAATSAPQQGIFKAYAGAGLWRDLSSSAGADDPRWVFKGEHLSISLTSPVPFTVEDSSNLTMPPGPWSSGAGVGPMQLDAKDFSAAASVTLELREQGVWTAYSAVTVSLVERALPASLWVYDGTTRPATPNADAPLLETVCGFMITATQYAPDTTATVDIGKLAYENDSAPMAFNWPALAAPTSDTFDQQSTGASLSFSDGSTTITCNDYVLSDITRPAAARLSMIGAMRAMGMAVDAGADVGVFATSTVLDNWPRVRRLGEM